MTFLQSEIKTLIKTLNRTNVYIPSWSMRPTWGSSTHMHVFLKAIEDLSQLRSTKKWDWDFLINLSESDFPLK